MGTILLFMGMILNALLAIISISENKKKEAMFFSFLTAVLLVFFTSIVLA